MHPLWYVLVGYSIIATLLCFRQFYLYLGGRITDPADLIARFLGCFVWPVWLFAEDD